MECDNEDRVRPLQAKVRNGRNVDLVKAIDDFNLVVLRNVVYTFCRRSEGISSTDVEGKFQR